MKYKAIIFDFDGVLFDSEKIHLQASNQVFRELGFTISEKEYFQRYVGLSDNDVFDFILNEKNIQFNPEQVKSLRQDKVAAYKKIINSSEFLYGISNVKNFIEAYEAIARFAICSGATREEIESTLEKLENGKLKKYFKYIISIEDVAKGKPSPEGYILTAQRLNLSPQHCLAIEDTPKGVSAAKDAGMSVVAITTSLSKSHFSNVDFIAENYNEIDAWIKS